MFGVDTDTIVAFKRRLDRHMDMQGIWIMCRQIRDSLGIVFSTMWAEGPV